MLTQTRMRDKERLEQNSMIVNISEHLKQVEARQEAIIKQLGASEDQTEHPVSPVPNPDEEDVIASLMHPRRHGTGLESSAAPVEGILGAFAPSSGNSDRNLEKSLSKNA